MFRFTFFAKCILINVRGRLMNVSIGFLHFFLKPLHLLNGESSAFTITLMQIARPMEISFVWEKCCLNNNILDVNYYEIL